MKKKITIWKLASGIIFAALGGVFIYSAIFMMPGFDGEWKDASLQAEGTVVKVRETYRNRAYCEYPVIQYSTQDNRSLTFTANDCYPKNTYRVGRKVNVRYSKSDPSNAFLDHGENDLSTEIAVVVFGLFLLAFGAVLIVVSVKKE